jgi:AAA domain
MLDYDDFISRPKSMLIAPAGFGKTTTVAECLKRTNGRQLILTHTHAGIAALKTKLRKEGVLPSQYSVETITGYAQKYVLSFDTTGSIPPQKNSRMYFPYLIEKSKELFDIDRILDIVTNTYSGLFVDEYQDCTVEQHELIQKLVPCIPARILGDPMQGIFGFGGQALVDMNSEETMGSFLQNLFSLDTPYRWRNNGSEHLGADLSKIRQLLEGGNSIDLSDFKDTIEYIQIDEYQEYEQLYGIDENFRKSISSLSNESSLLVIHPEPQLRTPPREAFIKHFDLGFDMVEAIDDPDFYYAAAGFDGSYEGNIAKRIREFAVAMLANLKGWKPDNPDEEGLIAEIGVGIERLKHRFSYAETSVVLRKIQVLPRIKCVRFELYNALRQALELAESEAISVTEAMIELRNNTRRYGRRVSGKCIGTTLLTKGLEFDTVAIINGDRFTCPKNLYVAMTRASKRLIVFSPHSILNPYR